jgi:hypothetical protein
MTKPGSILIIACGALAHEITALKRLNGWDHVDLKCLRADLHNRPEKITDAVKVEIDKARGVYERIYVGYADCGTGGRLDALLEREKIERLPGAHCYEFFATRPIFDELSEEEPGTLYLTDYLARHFDRIIIRGFGLNEHPELEAMLFANYTRLVYLSQIHDDHLIGLARGAADRLALEFEHRHTGYGELETSLSNLARRGVAPRRR